MFQICPSTKSMKTDMSQTIVYFLEFLVASCLANFICEYIVDHAAEDILPNNCIILAGGFTNRKLVKAVASTGVRLFEKLL